MFDWLFRVWRLSVHNNKLKFSACIRFRTSFVSRSSASSHSRVTHLTKLYLLQKHFIPGYSFLFMFDNATSRAVYPEDALCTESMNTLVYVFYSFL